MTAEVKWTKEELARFDKLLDVCASPRQLNRISGRLDMNAFVKEHGKEKCDAMFKHLEKASKS